MNRPMIGALIMSVLLLIYLAFTVNYAWVLIRDDSPLVNAMGYALVVLPVVGAWALFVELRFARASAKLMVRLEEADRLPTEFSTTASGRVERSSAEELFPSFAAEVENSPQGWEAWLRLGLAYDACGDRRRARWAVRRALTLSRT